MLRQSNKQEILHKGQEKSNLQEMQKDIGGKEMKVKNLKKRKDKHIIGTIESQYILGPFYVVYSDGTIEERIRFGNGAVIKTQGGINERNSMF